MQGRGILVDRDEDGYLLQVLPSRSATGPRSSSSFFELIERYGEGGTASDDGGYAWTWGGHR